MASAGELLNFASLSFYHPLILVILSTFGVICEGDGDDLYQVAILVDQLKHDDVQLRINAFNNLERIGK